MQVDILRSGGPIQGFVYTVYQYWKNVCQFSDRKDARSYAAGLVAESDVKVRLGGGA